MSRVDEALRRAGARPVEAPGPGVAMPELPAEGEAALATIFPGEQPVPAEPSARRPAVSAPPRAVHETEPSLRPAAEPAGVFARIDSQLAEKTIVDEHMLPVSREQYRRLAAVLHDAQADRGLKVVMVASAMPAEGKTLTASNLALTLSESYRRRVLLIDGDLRKPALHQVFRLDAASGLSEGLHAPEEAKLLVRQLSPHLALLPAGRPTPDPMAGLASPRMHRLIAEAREAFDWVIIDTPPLVMLPDAHLLAPIADGVLLVIRANATPHALVNRAVDAIGRDRILGVVLNSTLEAPQGSGEYGYGYLSTAAEATVRR